MGVISNIINNIRARRYQTCVKHVAELCFACVRDNIKILSFYWWPAKGTEVKAWNLIIYIE